MPKKELFDHILSIWRHIEDFLILKCPLRRHFFQKNVKKTEFLRVGPKIAIDELSVHTIVQMVPAQNFLLNNVIIDYL